MLITPAALNLTAISAFREPQLEAFEYALQSEQRFIGLSAPPGVGKSAIAMGLAKLLGGGQRTIILTANLGLQDQYAQDWGNDGLIDIRGRDNYLCVNDGLSCKDGQLAGCEEKIRCPYVQQYNKQNAADTVEMSYAYWLAAKQVKLPDVLILDEAHLAMNWLSKALDFYISEYDLDKLGLSKQIPIWTGDDLKFWKAEQGKIIQRATELVEGSKAAFKQNSNYGRRKQLLHSLKQAEAVFDRVRRLAWVSEDNWVCEKAEQYYTNRFGQDVTSTVWRFECVWPRQYKEMLFRNVEKVILMSATLRPKTLTLLGIKRSEMDFKDWGRQFSFDRGPVIWIPTARVNSRMKEADRMRWLDRHVEICASRNDRRGLVQSVSYSRAKEIADYLRLHNNVCQLDQIVMNGVNDPENPKAYNAFEKHINGPANSLLCSPSFSTGWDFKYDRAEYQILSKLPIPDSRTKVMKARLKDDPKYLHYVASQELMQSAGRLMRDYDDKGESLIVDDSWLWFQKAAASYLCGWFRVVKEDKLRSKPEKIGE